MVGNALRDTLPGQCESKEDIKIIGTTGRLLNNIDLEWKRINILRNPFDVIGSRYRRNKNRSSRPEALTIDGYKESLQQMKEVGGYYLHHEDFVAQPEVEFKACVDYLGLGCEDEWLKTVVSIVNKELIHSKHYFPWTSKYEDEVWEIINTDGRLEFYR